MREKGLARDRVVKVAGVAGLLLVGLVMLLGAVLVIGVINGGYTWRADCVTSRGTVERSYSYRITQVFPYLAPSEPGCRFHSGTRVALSAIGVWGIEDESAAELEAEVERSKSAQTFLRWRGLAQRLENGRGRPSTSYT